jgi:hypothetical protein
MADVSVEFGAKDTGLEQTLKTVQDELTKLEGEVKSGELSFEALQQTMRKLAQTERLQEQLQGMAEATKEAGEAAERAAEPARDLSEEFKKISEPLMTLGQRLSATSAELAELKNRAATAHMSAEELDATLKKIAELEATERRLAKLAKETEATGDAAGGAEPKVNALGKEAQAMGDKVEGAGQQANSSAGLFDAGFAKISAAFAVGNIAAKAFEKIVEGVFSAAKAVVDGFGQALDMGARLNALSQQTGESAGSLLVLEQAFRNSNVSADQVGTAINRLQNFMQGASEVGSKQSETMSKLGITLADLEGKTPTEEMAVFAKAITAIEDPTKRVALATEVFGQRLGGRLLPVLNEFPGSLDDARSKVGSLEQIMDDSAKTFDDFGNSIDAIKGKFAAFAAGILSDTLPAVAEFSTALEKVDAAGLGKQIGQELNPKLQDMANILRGTIDLLQSLGSAGRSVADDNGVLGSTYRAVNESLMGFNQMMHKTFTTFTPFGFLMQTLKNRGEELKESQDAAAESIEKVGDAAEEASGSMSSMVESSGNVQTSLDGIMDTGGEAFDSINRGATDFKSLIDDGNVSLSDMSGEISGQVTLTTKHVEMMGELNVSLGEANEKASQQLDKIEKQITAEQLRNEKIAERQAKSLEDYKLQVQINEELAKGNKEEAKRLESQREHTKLTERIMRETNVTEVAAANLATNLLNSKAAADQLTESIGGVRGGARGTKEELISVRGVIADIEKAKLEAAPERLRERTVEARKELKSMADFIGEDISKMSLDDILKKLGLDSSSFKNTDEKLRAVEGAIEKIGSADPADITPDVDLFNVNDKLEKIKEFLKTTGTEKPDVTPKIEQDSLKTAVDTAKETIQAGLTQNPVQVNLDAEKAIGQIREGLQEQIDIAIGSSEGTKHLLSIDGIVGKIEELLSKIEGKLPMQALA